MEGINKQKTGFKFGTHRLKVLRAIGGATVNGRTYKMVEVETNDGLVYGSLRLYNSSGKFIKQMLFEPSISKELAILFAEYSFQQIK